MVRLLLVLPYCRLPWLVPAFLVALAALEYRYGTPQFLTLPRANITPPVQGKQCARYSGVSLLVEYPAGLDQNTTSGEDFVVEAITKGLSSCPDQKYALFCYSQGATLMLNSLVKLGTSALESVKSVILVGNPYHIPRKISNVDSTAQHDEKPSVGVFAEDAIASNSTTPQLSAEVDHSGLLFKDDLVSSPSTACSCDISAGHLSYGLVDTVQQAAFRHVWDDLEQRHISRLKNRAMQFIFFVQSRTVIAIFKATAEIPGGFNAVAAATRFAIRIPPIL
ncbi:hypothetical protein ASPSYDRAFT_1173173 [Aspergillus sydowii CBS 593.65]|uniref:Uncharacterized protein n=1 Tax=Aspergillus sydowii CBS 593.65 TaxID=1036612 RepID=A0A1L9TQ86_9EURO|nr:uncharacterized protein ASPSYDRAFT_1173173 [Aspergillus sydowii CBS 593.65]OJJ61463.1 hypothetical protein ASPSYDRAFT_1173173 [Aspergillus sydowii CBS 593.65]